MNNQDSDLAQVIERLQEKITWLELALEDSGKEIGQLLNRVDRLERQVRFLASMQEPPSAVRPLSEETPPPHY